MLPKWHILIGFVFSYILAYFFNFSASEAIIVFVASFLLIDLDHFLFYIIKEKDFNFFKFYSSSLKEDEFLSKMKKSERNQFKRKLFIFHSIEFWVIFGILASFFSLFKLILLGFAIHMLADWLELAYRKENPGIKISTIYTILKNKGKKELNHHLFL